MEQGIFMSRGRVIFVEQQVQIAWGIDQLGQWRRSEFRLGEDGRERLCKHDIVIWNEKYCFLVFLFLVQKENLLCYKMTFEPKDFDWFPRSQPCYFQIAASSLIPYPPRGDLSLSLMANDLV